MVSIILNLKLIFKNIALHLSIWNNFKFFFLGIKSYLSRKSLNNNEETESIKFKNQNIVISSNPGDITSFLEIFSSKVYEPIFKLKHKREFKPFTLVDLGANIGMAYVYFNSLNLIKNYVGCEPLENNLKLLYFNTFSDNTKIYPKALWTNNHGVRFSTTNTSNSNSILKDGGIFVETITLSEIFKEIDDEEIFLKMDIEGAEYEILEKDYKLIASRAKYIIIEFHDIHAKEYLKYYEILEKDFVLLKEGLEQERFENSLIFGINKKNK